MYGYRAWTIHKSTQDRQTDKIRFMSLLILESKLDRRTNYVFFHHSCWNLSKTDRRTNYVLFHSSYCSFRQTDGQSMLHFIPHIRIYARQIKYVSFLPSWCRFRQTDELLVIIPSYNNPRQLNISYWDANMTDGRTNYI